MLIKRIICELRYKKTLLHFQERIPFAQNIRAKQEENFPTYNYNIIDISLLNRVKRRKLTITSGDINIYYDNEKIFKNFSKDALPIISEYPKRIKINKLIRIGIRQFYLVETDKTFEELNNNLISKLYRNKFERIIGKDIKDMAYAIVFDKDGYSYRIALGAVSKKEIIDRFIDVAFAPDNPDILPNTALLIDLDMYKIDLNTDDIAKFFNDCEKYCQPLALQIAKEVL